VTGPPAPPASGSQPAAFRASSRNRLTPYDLGRFTGRTLFDRIARAVCAARCLPRKELYESWEVARRARRLFRGGRVVDVAGGHGLLAHVMLLLDDSSASAVVVDRAIPASAAKLHDALADAFPRLVHRVAFVSGEVNQFDLLDTDVVVSIHACGSLTDEILNRAVAARAAVAVLPCCHNLDDETGRDLAGWLDGPLAMDVVRALRLKTQGYDVWTQTIPGDITPKNRLLLARPA
jgi:hypothetical protein